MNRGKRGAAEELNEIKEKKEQKKKRGEKRKKKKTTQQAEVGARRAQKSKETREEAYGGCGARRGEAKDRGETARREKEGGEGPRYWAWLTFTQTDARMQGCEPSFSTCFGFSDAFFSCRGMARAPQNPPAGSEARRDGAPLECRREGSRRALARPKKGR